MSEKHHITATATFTTNDNGSTINSTTNTTVTITTYNSTTTSTTQVNYSLLQWVPVVVIIHGACILLSSCPAPLSRLGLALDLIPEDSVALGMCAACLALMLVAVSLSR